MIGARNMTGVGFLDLITEELELRRQSKLTTDPIKDEMSKVTDAAPSIDKEESKNLSLGIPNEEEGVEPSSITTIHKIKEEENGKDVQKPVSKEQEQRVKKTLHLFPKRSIWKKKSPQAHTKEATADPKQEDTASKSPTQAAGLATSKSNEDITRSNAVQENIETEEKVESVKYPFYWDQVAAGGEKISQTRQQLKVGCDESASLMDSPIEIMEEIESQVEPEQKTKPKGGSCRFEGTRQGK